MHFHNNQVHQGQCDKPDHYDGDGVRDIFFPSHVRGESQTAYRNARLILHRLKGSRDKALRLSCFLDGEDEKTKPSHFEKVHYHFERPGAMAYSSILR